MTPDQISDLAKKLKEAGASGFQVKADGEVVVELAPKHVGPVLPLAVPATFVPYPGLPNLRDFVS